MKTLTGVGLPIKRRAIAGSLAASTLAFQFCLPSQSARAQDDFVD